MIVTVMKYLQSIWIFHWHMFRSYPQPCQSCTFTFLGQSIGTIEFACFAVAPTQNVTIKPTVVRKIQHRNHSNA